MKTAISVKQSKEGALTEEKRSNHVVEVANFASMIRMMKLPRVKATEKRKKKMIVKVDRHQS